MLKMSMTIYNNHAKTNPVKKFCNERSAKEIKSCKNKILQNKSCEEYPTKKILQKKSCGEKQPCKYTKYIMTAIIRYKSEPTSCETQHLKSM